MNRLFVVLEECVRYEVVLSGKYTARLSPVTVNTLTYITACACADMLSYTGIYNSGDCHGVGFGKSVVNFIKIWIFSTHFRKILKYQISWKSVKRELSYCMRTDGQIDATKLIAAFRNFVKAPKIFIVPPTQCNYEYCVDLRRNSDYFPIQH